MGGASILSLERLVRVALSRPVALVLDPVCDITGSRKKDVRILHIFDHSLPLQSGYVTRSLGIIRAQRAKGWETFHLTTPRHGKTAADEETLDGLTFTRSPTVGRSVPVLTELAEMRTTQRAIERLA